jgi:hypothetical protein
MESLVWPADHRGFPDTALYGDFKPEILRQFNAFCSRYVVEAHTG